MENIQYNKKLELSFKIVLNELVNPHDWETRVKDLKYKIDPDTGSLVNEIVIPLLHKDDIELNDDSNCHSYIFKRSHFYNKNKRLRYEMESAWNSRGYYVKLIKPEYPNTTWRLKLSWKYN